jgi:RNA polymerase sigma-70 factor (ECF subfamily)
MVYEAGHKLFQQAKRGDKKAFDCLQRQLEPMVKRFARRLLGGGESEDDIAQEAFLALYLNLDRIDPVEKLRPFLFRIVRNLCYDELRKRGRYERMYADYASTGDFHSTAISSSSDTLHWSMLYSEVQKAIDRLPELQRQTIILYFEEDLSYEEIAQAMGANIGTVKSRIHYARRNLAKLLGPEILGGRKWQKMKN